MPIYTYTCTHTCTDIRAHIHTCTHRRPFAFFQEFYKVPRDHPWFLICLKACGLVNSHEPQGIEPWGLLEECALFPGACPRGGEGWLNTEPGLLWTGEKAVIGHGLQASTGGPKPLNAACISTRIRNRKEGGGNPENESLENSGGLVFLKGRIEKIERRFKIAADWALWEQS